MDNDDIKLLLVRYITNQASDAEAKEVRHWLNLHPENELYFVELYETWQNILCTKTRVIDDKKAYRLFLAKTAKRKKPVNVLRWAIAAAVLLLFISVVVSVVHDRADQVPEKNQVSAQNGSVKKLLLIDGTVVWLNAGSIIKYDDNFDKTNRTVYLEGEAFFEVGHDAKNIPFLVKSKKYTIRDIGTKFNLKAYPTDSFFEATVVQGEVAVENNAETNTKDVNRIYVKPNQVLKIFYSPGKSKVKELIQPSSSYNEVRVTQIDSAKTLVYDGWKDDLLIFDGNTLNEIARVLERRYDVEINIDAPGLQNIRYSGSFKNVPDIDQVLNIIKQNTPISFTVEGRKITITKTD